MPIYEYECQSCKERLEMIQKISDPPLRVCPSCGAEALNKLVSAAAFRLAGGGWYETDFKKSGQRNLKEAAATSQTPASANGTGDKAAPAAKKTETSTASTPAKASTSTASGQAG